MAKATLNLDKAFKIELDDTVDNTTKIPVIISGDVSGSMIDKPLKQLGDSIQTTLEYLSDNDYTRTSVELSLIAFNELVKVVQDFSPVDDIYFENNLKAEGLTYMGKAVNFAIDSLQAKLQEYKSKGSLYKAPLLILITDGIPSDDITAAANRCADLVARRKLTFLGIGVGDHADMNELKRFNPKGRVIKAPSFDDLEELLIWVSYQLSATSQAGPGEEVQSNVELDPKFKLF